MIRAVFFDVGETILNEARELGRWADWLGVPPHTFAAVFGAAIARGLDPGVAFDVFRPGFDRAAEYQRRTDSGVPSGFADEDLYPDARACLSALRAQGIRVGIAGNQARPIEDVLQSLNLDVDVIATSGGWGVEKPAAAFFERVVGAAGCAPGEVLYVGDRLDNDMRPAQQVGLLTALIRRGPWGFILDDPEVVARCLFRLESLTDLPDLVRHHNEAVLG